ncbi:MAG: zinc-ribbon domain-containing protein, partial [Clostridiales bacterium]|nr:zinc-ribbon domain-containing protein [Clostridiales bacterium]
MISIFCVHCGKQLQPGTAFCSGCGAKAEGRQETPRSELPPTRLSQQKPIKGRVMDFVVISVAIILILMGIGSMALTVVGSTTTAQVTGYEQVLFINNDDSTRNPSRYKLEYQFAVGGERYTGSVTRVFE